MSRLNNKWKRSLLALVAVIALVAGQIPIAAFGEAAQQAALEANDLPMADLPADDLQVDDVDAQSADDPEAPAAEDQDDEVPEQEAAEPEENTTGVDIELAIQSDGSGETPLSVAAASCQLYVGRNVAGGRMKVETPTASNEGINLQFGVHEGDEITLTALPASGYKFVGWYLGIPGSPNWSYVEGSGPYSTDKVYTFTMGDSDQKICAVYEEAAPCTLYVGRNGDHGSIKADGVQTSSGWVSTGKYPLYEGNDITLHANAPAGYVFVGWYPGTLSNDTVTGYDESAQPYSTNADYSFTMGTEDRQICAVFESATAADSVNLSVTTDANGVLYIDDSNYGSSFTGTYPQGRQVKLEAQPKYSDYEFDHWEVTKGDATQATTVTDNPYTLTLNESASAVAVFRHVPNSASRCRKAGR